MALVDWYIEGPTFGNCNCDYGCPCQFELKPSHGHCRGFEVLRITRGHFGEVSLGGLSTAAIYAWPGPIYEGGGELQLVIDERATPAQRQALETVLLGGETEPGKTHWWVFRTMSDRLHPTLYKPIHFTCDVAARKAEVSVPGVLEASGRPIVSPATGEPHRVRIDLPDGIEFAVAEIGSGSARGTAAIDLQLSDSFGQFHVMRQSGRGVVRAS